MTKKPKTVKYAVRLARVRFETLTIEIDAGETEAARSEVLNAALNLAESSGDERWKLEPFDKKSYCPFVQDYASQADADSDPGDDEPGTLADYVVEGAEELRYMLLAANVNDGEGYIVPQPWWILHCAPLMQEDVAGDWAGGVSELAGMGSDEDDQD